MRTDIITWGLVLAISPMLFTACGGSGSKSSNENGGNGEKATIDSATDKGIGPISNVELTDVNTEIAGQGKSLFELKCTVCHNINQKLIGPALAGITSRRTPEWIMNMLLNPVQMQNENEAAKQLLKEYNNVPMTDLQLTEEEARQILEFLRTI
ncbi:MAG: cytochrome c [Cytophagales bacterium]|nr:cytochrome c [Cytophagales bacterium]